MTNIEIYTKDYCPYCTKAKDLLKKKQLKFTEYDVTHDKLKFEEMVNRSGGRKTVPQVFIDLHHVGGCDDLHAADANGSLAELLS